MRMLFLFFVLVKVLLAQIAFQGEVSTIATHQDTKRSSNQVLYTKLELKDNSWYIALEGLYDTQDRQRRYLQANEAYLTFEEESSDWRLGRSVLFWGALEAYNLSDTFNTFNLLFEPFETSSKLGSYAAIYRYFLEEATLSVLIKLYEEDQKLQDNHSPYLPQALTYNRHLTTQASPFRPSVFLKYSHSDAFGDWSFIAQNGYDNNRLYQINGGVLNQYAYLATKLTAFDTLAIGDTLYKIEAAYAIPTDRNNADYYQLGLGVEHTLYNLLMGADIGLLGEYYKSDSNTIPFANDFFVGLRIALNNTNDSTLLAGIIQDSSTKESLYKAEFSTRLLEQLTLNLNIYALNKTDWRTSDFLLIEEHTQFNLKLTYHF